MSFYTAFPSSPLSRSALASQSAADPRKLNRAQSNPPKTYGSISSLLSPDPPQTSSFETIFHGHNDWCEAAPSSPRGLGPSARNSAPSPRHISGPARLMHSPLVPSWSSSDAPSFDDGHLASPLIPSSNFTRSANSRRRSSAYSISSSSSTPHFGSLVGSFQESLLSGRMSMPASKPLTFDAEIGVLGMGKCKPSLRCPPHLHIKFPAHFYDFHALDAPPSTTNLGSTAALGSPYVGTIDLEAHYHNQLLARRLSALTTETTSVNVEPIDVPSFPGYAVPPKGQVQLIVKYPDLNAVKLFLVPYDLTDMKPGTKTFVRQKTVTRPISGASTRPGEALQPGSRNSPNNVRTPPKEALRFAIHLQFCCPPLRRLHNDSQAGFEGPEMRRFRTQNGAQKHSCKPAKSPRYYLHKSIRLVFGARALNSDEKLIDQIETPGEGPHRFSDYNGPEEDWLQLHHEVKATQAQLKLEPMASSATSPAVTASSSMHLAGSNAGIDIRACERRLRASSPQDGPASKDAPLNSDPNGERWQGSSSAVRQIAEASARPSGFDQLSTSNWTMSSREGSYGEPTSAWAIHGSDISQASDLSLRATAAGRAAPRLLSLAAQRSSATPSTSDSAVASSATPGLREMRSDEFSASHLSFQVGLIADPLSSTTAARFVPGNDSSLPPSVPRSRIRSASLASLCKAHVQSVSEFGCPEEPSAPRSEPLSAESTFPLVHQRSAVVPHHEDSDKSTLLRKWSEQFARSHTPSPIGSPKLRPTRRHAGTGLEDKMAQMALDNGTEGSCNDDQTTSIMEQHQQRVTRFIR